jgi:hypothetical protein
MLGGLWEGFEATRQIRHAAQSLRRARRIARNAQNVASFSAVIPREGGESSIPRRRDLKRLLRRTGSPAFAGDDSFRVANVEA